MLILLVLLAADPEPPLPSEAEFKQIQAMTRMAAADMHTAVPPNPEHSRANVPVTLDAKGIDAALRTLSQSFYLQHGSGRAVEVEADVFNVPNVDTLELAVAWKDAVSKDGKNVLRPATAEELEDVKRFGGGRVHEGEWTDKVPVGDDADSVVRASGDATVSLATAFDQAVVDCASPGQKVPFGKMTVTLVACTGASFTVRLDNVPAKTQPLEGTQLVALDKGGLGLALATSDSEPLFAGDKHIADITYADFKKGPINKFELKGLAMGAVSKVALYASKHVEKRTIKVVATREPHQDEPATTTRYVAPFGAEPTFAPVDVASWKKDTSVRGGRASAMMGFNQPRFYVRLPASDASAFAALEIDKLAPKLKKKSKWNLEDNGYEAGLHQHAYTVASEGPKTLDASRIAGTVKMHVPTGVHALTLSAKSPESNGVSVKLEKNRAAIKVSAGEIASHPSFASAGYEPVRGFDAAGRELRLLPFQGSEDDSSLYYFWGTPASVRVILIDGWSDLAVPFSVAVPPPLPKEKSGDPGDL